VRGLDTPVDRLTKEELSDLMDAFMKLGPVQNVSILRLDDLK
jgi:hypothetical protein